VINGGDGDDNLMVAPETASLFGDDGNDYVNGDGFADAVASTLALESPTNATGDFALLEASGLVVSRGTDNGTPTGNRVLWTIQDHSDNATRTWLYANLPTGATRGYYELGNATGSSRMRNALPRECCAAFRLTLAIAA
jgi:hypothetical protein